MEIVRTESGKDVTLKLKGCLDTAATPEFASALDSTVSASSLTLDMSELEFVASSALRLLVAVKKRRGAGFALSLTGMNEVVREVFDVTGLDEIFEVR